MERSSGRSDSLEVKDVFEIKERHGLGHHAGLVVVLDRLISEDPASLVGKAALIRTPNDGTRRARIDGARDHGVVNSLFFESMTTAEVPVGSTVIIHPDDGVRSDIGVTAEMVS